MLAYAGLGFKACLAERHSAVGYGGALNLGQDVLPVHGLDLS